MAVISESRKHGDDTTNIHSLTALHIFPIKADELHLPYEFLKPRQKELTHKKDN